MNARNSTNPGFQKFNDRNWTIVAELESVAKELRQPMAVIAMNWIANRPMVASVIVGATTLPQLQTNLQTLAFTIPSELSARLERVSRPERRFPYTFFESVIQEMIHGGKPVGDKPPGYYPAISIEAAENR